MALGPDSFQSARLKIQRANRHITELDAELRAYTEGGCFSIDMKYKTDLSDCVVMLRPSKPIPNSLPLIVGDALHNLRTALDHVVAACFVSQGLDPDTCHFPFRKKVEEFVPDKGKLKTLLETIETALPGARNCILDEIQPYEGGKLGIYPLNPLDLIDKHNELLLVSHKTLVTGFKLTFDQSGRIEIKDCWFNPQEPTTLYRGPGKPSVECDFKAALDVRLDKSLPLGNKPVLPALRQLADATAKSIELLAALVT